MNALGRRNLKANSLQVIPLSPIRISDEDLVLGGGRILVPKNTSIWTPIMPLHRSSRLYDRPNE
jgi:cytochrome P450